ncbi:MAG: GumC family protein, partial [Desulfobacterales bacterium]
MDEESIHLKDYFQVLLRRKYLILLVLIVCLPFVFIQAFSYTPVYKASAKLFIQESNTPNLISDSRYRYDPGFLTTQAQIIKSNKVGEKVVRNLDLDETYRQYFPENNAEPSLARKVKHWLRNFYQTALKLAGLAGEPAEKQPSSEESLSEAEKKERRIRSLAKMVSSGISVGDTASQDRQEGNIVEVGFISTSPDFAEKIVNNVASAYKQFLLEMRMESTSETIEWMKTKAASQREKLESSEKKLQEYKKEHDIYTVDDDEALFPSKISGLSQRLTQAQTEVKELESLYQEINRISPQEALNIPEVADKNIVQDLRQKIIDKEQEIQSLSKKIGEKHPRMARARNDLESLNEKLKQAIQEVIQSVKNKYELAEKKATGIELLLDQTKQNASTMSDKLIQYEILNRDVEVNRLLYDRLISRIKEYDATENKQTIDVWVVEKAQTPGFPMNQRPKRTILLGLLVSLMAGIGLAFFLEYLDNTVKTTEDAETRTEVPVLGMVPLFKDKTYEIEKIAHQLPHSAISERYKAIRTVLLLSASEDQPNSILIASMAQKAGKTVTAVNLAISLAQSRRRVLLIDADMRRPRIQKILGIDNTQGLSTYLSLESGLAVASVDLSDELAEFLHILPAGPIPSNPSELLSSARLEELMHQLKPDYDFILIDSPPMVDVTDVILKTLDKKVFFKHGLVSFYNKKVLACIAHQGRNFPRYHLSSIAGARTVNAGL